MTLLDSIAELQRSGYRRRHAAFLAHVLACGGYFLRRQLVAATQQPDGGVATTFLRRLVARGYAHRGVYGRRTRLVSPAGLVSLRDHRGRQQPVPTPRRPADDRAPAHDARHGPGVSGGASAGHGRGEARVLRRPATAVRRSVPDAVGPVRTARPTLPTARVSGPHAHPHRASGRPRVDRVRAGTGEQPGRLDDLPRDVRAAVVVPPAGARRVRHGGPGGLPRVGGDGLRALADGPAGQGAGARAGRAGWHFGGTSNSAGRWSGWCPGTCRRD